MKVIKYTPDLKINNLDAMAYSHKKARYLECIVSHNGTLIAKQWRVVIPKKYEVLIDLK